MTSTLHIPGKPATKGSVRVMPNGYTKPMCDRLVTWSSTVALIARSEQVPLLTGPVRIGIEARLERPRKHYRTDGSLKADAPWLPITKPDLDKIKRAVLDALTGIAYRDDAQVTTAIVTKRYGPIACTLIEIGEDQS